MQILSVKESDRILIIAPHPDDECIGAGGILAMYSALCRVLVLTDGRQGQGDAAPEIEKEIRKQEFAREMQFLGITDYQMLEYEDGTLMQHTDCLERVDLSCFTKVFVTGIHDGHPDHTAACVSVFQALRRQSIDEIEIYLYEIHAPLREVTHLLDITEVMERKQELIRFHQSQLGTLPYDRLAKSMAEYRALQNRMRDRYVEAFACMPPEKMPDDSSIELEHRLQKSILFYWVLTRWLGNMIDGQSVAERITALGYSAVAVYGYAEIGQLLCRELQKSGVEVAYVLDRKVKKAERDDLPVYVPKKGLPEVDAVIVTAVYYYEEIEKELSEFGFKNVISFNELVGKGEMC
ncbi:hypothetical protein D7V90_15980 [bacterium 1xD42-87]|nr:hypothetical protein D7V90_15980 [bacterium 1xD42-87]